MRTLIKYLIRYLKFDTIRPYMGMYVSDSSFRGKHIGGKETIMDIVVFRWGRHTYCIKDRYYEHVNGTFVCHRQYIPICPGGVTQMRPKLVTFNTKEEMYNYDPGAGLM